MNVEKKHRTAEVFGIGRDLPLNYVEREGIDDLLIDSLSRDKHIVVYGSSKQGKTSLRKRALQDEEYVTVHCHSKWVLEDIHAAILKAAGYELELSNTKAVSGRNKLIANFTASVFGTGVGSSAEKESEDISSHTRKPIELDASDVNDIIKALEKFKRFIVLEDFHYLPIETQREFSVALKAFHEQSRHTFIITGVWLEESRLAVYNGDLAGRLLGIDADKWTSEQLAQVIEVGGQLLNVSFDDAFAKELLQHCQDSVYVVQEVCLKVCQLAQVSSTRDEMINVGVGLDATEIVQQVVSQQSGRYNAFITQFAAGFQDTALQMHRWLLYPLITADISSLERGLRYKEIRENLQGHHPSGHELNPGNVTQALQSTASLQVKKNIKPIVLDYDQTNLKLSVVDRGFLVWMRVQDKAQLLELAELPTDM